MAFAAAGIAPPAGEGVLHAQRAEIGDAAIAHTTAMLQRPPRNQGDAPSPLVRGR
jgi:hypothetical protein